MVQKEFKSTSLDLTSYFIKILSFLDGILKRNLWLVLFIFEVKIQELVHVDAFAHPSELSTSTSALSGDFKKLFEVKRKLRARRIQLRHS